MARVAVWLPGLPAPYDGTSIESIASYVKDVSEFLSSPLTRLVCQCHPNHIALLSGPSIIPPRGVFSSWWSYFDAIGVNEKHMLNGRPGLSIASNGAPDLDPLKQLVSAGTLPDAAPVSLKDFIHTIRTLQLDRTSEHFLTTSAFQGYSSESDPCDSFIGMSPKKSHEVSRLSFLIRTMALHCSDGSQTKVVDAGSGQGYLSYKIAGSGDSSRGKHSAVEVLALESDKQQLDGARKRAVACDARRNQKGLSAAPVTFCHAHVSDTASLKAAVDDWMIAGSSTNQPKECTIPQERERLTNVIFTGLHTCGSLTPSMLRAFADLAGDAALGPSARMAQDSSPQRPWRSSALALVGCCYNLLQPSDFPLSSRLQDRSLLKLHVQHLQLACQCPIQWTLSHDAWERSRVARRKIVYRALLGRVVSMLLSQSATSRPEQPGWSSDEALLQRMQHSLVDSIDLDEGRAASGSATLAGMRLGRLSAQQYADWPTFLRAALNRLIAHKSSLLSHLNDLDIEMLCQRTMAGTDPPNPKAGDNNPRETEELSSMLPAELASRLACLHVLRSMIGPVIESVIIADQVLYLADNLPTQPIDTADRLRSTSDNSEVSQGDERRWMWRVSAMNLFVLESGSARNVVITAEKVWE